MNPHLNIFVPYQSKPGWHEDQLTRSFLILLRCIPMAQTVFVNLVRERQMARVSLNPLPPLTRPNTRLIEVETQVAREPDWQARIVSVLMTDEHHENPPRIEPCERDPRYDGVIHYGPGFTLIIENKLAHEKVWDDQLKPVLSDPTAAEVDPVLADVRWRDVIDHLAGLLDSQLVSGAEQVLIEDFLEYAFHHFPGLNPYTTFGCCRDSFPLLRKRCEAVLEELAPGSVRYHQGWSHHILLRGVAKKVALRPESTEGGWQITLRLYPGDTMGQARALYPALDRDRYLALESEGWRVGSNLHYAHIQSNLVWPTTSLSTAEFVDLWTANPGRIVEEKRGADDFAAFFTAQLQDGLAAETDRERFDAKFKAEDRNHLRVCPGLAAIYSWSAERAVELDRQGAFAQELRRRIDQSLSTWGQTFQPV